MPSKALESLPLCYSTPSLGGSETFISYMGSQGPTNKYMTSTWRPDCLCAAEDKKSGK